MSKQVYLAALDLGSNSFRCEIGRLDEHQGTRHITRVDYLKETVRLGGGLDKHGRLSDEAMTRGLACLARFAERLRGFHPDYVRAVATQTLREAINRDVFVDQAQRLLGFPIEVISGREEARLIYSGVANLLHDSDERRLVIDIGGRSTEMILGKRLKAQVAESHRVGSVSLSQRYFPEGKFTEKAFKDARVSAAAALEESLDVFSKDKWDVAYGSSGTIGALAGLLSANEVDDNAVTLEGLAWCREKLLRASSADKLKLPGLKEERKAVIGGGIAILEALLESFEIAVLIPAKGALRQGVLFDMLGRQEAGGQSDMRHETVARLQAQFRVDTLQATRVEEVAVSLYNMLRNTGDMSNTPPGQDDLNELRWVCRLHEIGMSVSHSEFHKHGAYIVEKADAAGFSQWQQARMSQLMLGQRGSLRKVMQPLRDRAYALQLLSLRLALILCHARRMPDANAVSLFAKSKGELLQVNVVITSAWMQHHPQTLHLLREEVLVWDKLPLTLMLLEQEDELAF